MEECIENLCSVIYMSEGNFNQSYQLVVSSVMATDIEDKDLKPLHNDWWDKAFSKSKRETSRVSGEQSETSLYPSE